MIEIKQQQEFYKYSYIIIFAYVNNTNTIYINAV